MNFSYAKKITLRPEKELKLSTFLIALLCAAVIFVPYMVLSEGYFVFFGDFNVQQIPFYQMCHKMIKSGNIKWNWLTDLGSNFIGSYSFYLLGSPFFWLTIPFPNSFVPYLLGPLLILKFASAALTSYLYIRRFTKTPEAARLGGLLYAFSGFSVYNIFFNHFHEPLIFFPLLLLSLELLITENKRGVFAITVALCALVNYFFFFGMAIFTAIYFFVRLFSNSIKVKFSRFLIVVVEAVLGFLMSAFLLLPSILAIISNSRISEILLGWSAITYGKEQIYLNIIECFFFPPDLPARPVFFPGADVKWSSLGGWLPLFGMTGVFTLFINKKGSWMKRVIGICIFMALVPILNSAFYAFNTAYYARWFYMPVLIMALATTHLLEDKTVDFVSGFKWAFGVSIGFALAIGLFPQKDDGGNIIYGLYTQADDLTYVVRFWVAVAISLFSLVIVAVLIKLRKDDLKAFFKISTVCVCVISVIYASLFVGFGRSHSYEIKDTMIDDLIEGEVFIDDNSDFRIDTFDGIDNTGMYLGFSSINAFHSVVPSSIMEFYDFLDVDRSVASRPDTDIPAIRSLLSVKYLLNRTDGDKFVDENGQTKMPEYKYIKTSGGYYVYENENYIPYGFSYDYYVTEEYLKDFSADLKSRMLLKAILLNENQIKKYKDCLTNIEDLKSADFENEETKDAVSMNLSDSEMKNDAKRLKKTSAKSFKTDNDGFTATVNRDKRSLVFFSVPFDEGWSATVNGKEATIEKVNKGFMAVVVPSGKSEIRFDYETPGLQNGILISLSSLFVFLVYYLISAFYIRENPGNTEYPEGKELIDRWHKADIADAISEFNDEDDDSDYDGLPDKDIIAEIKEKIETDNSQIKSGFTVNTDVFDD